MFRRLFIWGGGLIFSFCLMLWFSLSVSAAEVRVIPNQNLSLVQNFKLRMRLDTSTFDSVTYDSRYFGRVNRIVVSVGQDPVDGVFICVKDGIGAGTYTGNLITYQFRNVASVGGRFINCEISLTRLLMHGPMSDSFGVYRSSVMGATSGNFQVFAHDSSRIGNELDVSLKITWADTGEVVDLPFAQALYDVDIARPPATYPNAYLEGFQFTSGYQNLFYVWDGLTSIVGDYAFHANPTLVNTDVNGDDSWIKTGCIVMTSGGDLRFRFMGQNCGSAIFLYSSCFDVDEPDKFVDNSKAYYEGDTVVYTIEKSVESFYTDTISEYVSLVMKDTLPEGLDYVSAAFYKNGTEVTSSYGTLSYDSSLHLVSYSISANRLSQLSFYDGGTIRLVITAKVNAKGSGVLSNTGFVFLDGIEFVTDPVTIEVRHKIVTSKVGEGVISESVSNLVSGSKHTVTYTPAVGWYLADLLVDGVSVGADLYPSSYLFSNIQSNHAVHAVFLPYYKITTEVVNGTITSTDTTIKVGEDREVVYSPLSSDYYLKSITVDGVFFTAAQLQQYVSSIAFSDISSNHVVKVVYAKVPELVITKELQDEIIWKKGSPEFQFVISGTDYLGERHNYYRSIVFGLSDGSSKSVRLRIPAGVWTVMELSVEDWSLRSVCAGVNCVVQGVSGVLDTRNADSAAVTFVNYRSDWHTYTENDTEVNVLK